MTASDLMIAKAYDELAAKSSSERVEFYRQMPSSVKSGLWAHHLSTALAHHPEFTDEQRAVVEEALSLLCSEFFEIDASNPAWPDRVGGPLGGLTERAKALFGVQTARALFAQLGPDTQSR